MLFSLSIHVASIKSSWKFIQVMPMRFLAKVFNRIFQVLCFFYIKIELHVFHTTSVGFHAQLNFLSEKTFNTFLSCILFCSFYFHMTILSSLQSSYKLLQRKHRSLPSFENRCVPCFYS